MQLAIYRQEVIPTIELNWNNFLSAEAEGARGYGERQMFGPETGSSSDWRNVHNEELMTSNTELVPYQPGCDGQGKWHVMW